MKKSINTKTSFVSFQAKKLGFITVKGKISDLNGQIAFDNDHPENAVFQVGANIATIDTGNKKRDEHLKSEDFFSVNIQPSVFFKSSNVTTENGQFKLTGELTMLQTTKQVEIPFEENNGVFTGVFSLQRSDYNLGQKFPKFFIGDTIQVSIQLSLEE